MKRERSNIKFPMWRKKVDSSLFEYKFTPIPNFAVQMWNIPVQFHNVYYKKDTKSKIKIIFKGINYKGNVTITTKGRKSPLYRLHFDNNLVFELKLAFIMSYMRNIEQKLGDSSSIEIEENIPFWEFLDIEYDENSKVFYLTDYYTHKPDFPLLFTNIVGSPTIRKIDDAIYVKDSKKIYSSEWKKREYLNTEIEAENVIYTLIDTRSKLIYIGEGEKLVRRVLQPHKTISNWNYYRYTILPKELSPFRIHIERMMIRNHAMLLDNKKEIDNIRISEYSLSNNKIDK